MSGNSADRRRSLRRTRLNPPEKSQFRLGLEWLLGIRKQGEPGFTTDADISRMREFDKLTPEQQTFYRKRAEYDAEISAAEGRLFLDIVRDLTKEDDRLTR